MRPLLLLPLLALAACDNGSTDTPRLSGTYVGNTSAPTFRESHTWTLSESNGIVTGTGTSVRTFLRTGRDTTFAGEQISGQHFHPSLNLSVSTPNFIDYGFTGTVSSDGRVLTGTLFQSGYENIPLTMTRQ